MLSLPRVGYSRRLLFSVLGTDRSSRSSSRGPDRSRSSLSDFLELSLHDPVYFDKQTVQCAGDRRERTPRGPSWCTLEGASVYHFAPEGDER